MQNTFAYLSILKIMVLFVTSRNSSHNSTSSFALSCSTLFLFAATLSTAGCLSFRFSSGMQQYRFGFYYVVHWLPCFLSYFQLQFFLGYHSICLAMFVFQSFQSRIPFLFSLKLFFATFLAIRNGTGKQCITILRDIFWIA